MPSYLYKLYADDNDKYYVGSTRNELRYRKHTHKTQAFAKQSNSNVCNWMREIGRDNIKIKTIESFNDIAKDELLQKEDELIIKFKDDINCLNQRRTTHNKKEYYQENKEEYRRRARIYRDLNRDKLREKDRKYRMENRELINARRRKGYKLDTITLAPTTE